MSVRLLGPCCAALLLLALAACGTGGGGTVPMIGEFVADPSTVAAGESVALRWRVEALGSGDVRLESLSEGAVEPVQLGEVTGQSGTVVRVDETTTFRLIATSSGGTAREETTVRVEQPEPEIDLPSVEEFRAAPMIVRPGEPVTLTWEVSHAETITLFPLGEELEQAGSLMVLPDETTDYTIVAESEHGTATASVRVEVDESERLLFLVAGQSNASGTGLEEGKRFPVEGVTEEADEGVHMLTREFDWVAAKEPTHEGEKHSFLVRFGNEVKRATGADVYLVPTAVAGSSLSSWDPDDTSNNFAEAMELARYAAESLGVPFAAVIWYQGESDTKSRDRRDAFVRRTDEVLEAFRHGLEGDPGVIFVQLSKRLWTEELNQPGNVEKDHNLAYQIVREQQRLMERGARSASVGSPGGSEIDRTHYYMAVAHDLPMSDAKHLSAEGQRVLGTRIAEVYLACVWRSCDAPPGPRLEELHLESTATESAVLVHLSEPVNAHPDYDGYFAVFVDGQMQPDLAISLDVTQTVIRLGFSPAVAEGSTVEVRYMPPQEMELFASSENVVKALQSPQLPLPAFGMPVEPPPDGVIPGLRLPDE